MLPSEAFFSSVNGAPFCPIHPDNADWSNAKRACAMDWLLGRLPHQSLNEWCGKVWWFNRFLCLRHG